MCIKSDCSAISQYHQSISSFTDLNLFCHMLIKSVISASVFNSSADLLGFRLFSPTNSHFRMSSLICGTHSASVWSPFLKGNCRLSAIAFRLSGSRRCYWSDVYHDVSDKTSMQQVKQQIHPLTYTFTAIFGTTGQNGSGLLLHWSSSQRWGILKCI